MRDKPSSQAPPARELPTMSVILVTDVMATVAAVIETFRRQTIADRIELVLATGPCVEVPDGVRAGFLALQVIEVQDPYEVHEARARCVRAATAPVVVLGETHCMPEPDCCEQLLAGFAAAEVAIVGARVLCANPQTTLAQAAHLMDYGPWAHGPRGARSELPAHNVAFRRDFLLELGDRLADALDINAGLNERLQLEGRTLLFEPAARTQHLNVSRIGPWVHERLQNGRAYAGQVAAGWPWPRRLAYALAWPLIAAVRFARLAPVTRAGGLSRRSMPTLVIGLVIGSFGEAAGFLAGHGEALRERHRIEIHKGRYLQAGEATAAFDRVVASYGAA